MLPSEPRVSLAGLPRRLRFVLAVLAAGLATATSATEAPSSRRFVHPGLLQNQQDLDFMKAQIRSGTEPWKGAFERLRAPKPGRGGGPARTVLDFNPQPFTHVIRGAYGRPAIGSAELLASADAAYAAALLWSVTNDPVYAKKAIEIIDAWSATLWDFEDNDAKLLAGWTGHTWCNAAEILRYSAAGWSQAGVRQFERMLRTVYCPLLQNFMSDSNGNWDAAIIDTTLAMAVFLDDHTMFNHAVDRFLRGSGNGGITKYVYPSGQCQETTRDAGHVQLGLGELAQAAQIAWTQGVDLFGAAGNRLALGLEYAARYYAGEPVPIKGIPSSAGRFTDVYQGAFEHYRLIKGLDLPFISRACAATEGSSTIRLLTSRRAPQPGGTASLRPLTPSAIATDAGAAAEPTAVPPADAVHVAAGQSIQDALDAAAGTGKWIVLEKGVYQLSAALKMPSGVTLAGSGRDTILFLDPKLTADMFSPAGTVLVNGDAGLHDVTIRDLVVEGGITTKRATTNDPNQDRRARSYQTAPSRAGIAFLGQSDRRMRNLTFDHVTVRNCTHNGVAIIGAAQIAITRCDFSDSGASVMPGARSLHNLVLSHVEAVTVQDSQFDTSPWGCGIEVTMSRDIALERNELARNALHGVDLADCTDVRIVGNLIEGNDGHGVAVVGYMDGSRHVAIRDNIIQCNGQSAFEIVDPTGTSVAANALGANGAL